MENFGPCTCIAIPILDVMADLMPDVAMSLGIEVNEDVLSSTLVGPDNETVGYDGTRLLKQERRFCPVEL